LIRGLRVDGRDSVRAGRLRIEFRVTVAAFQTGVRYRRRMRGSRRLRAGVSGRDHRRPAR
jgi:hypothetical protein